MLSSNVLELNKYLLSLLFQILEVFLLFLNLHRLKDLLELWIRCHVATTIGVLTWLLLYPFWILDNQR